MKRVRRRRVAGRDMVWDKSGWPFQLRMICNFNTVTALSILVNLEKQISASLINPDRSLKSHL
jgi:hypothetical protein